MGKTEGSNGKIINDRPFCFLRIISFIVFLIFIHRCIMSSRPMAKLWSQWRQVDQGSMKQSSLFVLMLFAKKISHVFDLIPSILVQVDTSASIQNEDDGKRKRILVKGSDDKFKMADQLHSYIEFKK